MPLCSLMGDEQSFRDAQSIFLLYNYVLILFLHRRPAFATTGYGEGEAEICLSGLRVGGVALAGAVRGLRRVEHAC